MTRFRTTIALATVLTLSAVFALPMAAGATQSAVALDQTADVTTAQVQVQVLYRPTPDATPVKLSPNAEVEVSFWKLDGESGFYYPQTEGTWTEGGPGQVDTSAALEPGTYTIRFLADDVSIGVQWWDSARYFFETTPVVLAPGDVLDLGSVVLEPRTFDVSRIWGADRYETAVAASQATVPDGSSANVVYIANGANYPDALAAGPAAIWQGGVLLLTKANSLPEVTSAELLRVAPDRVVVVGGTGAVSAAVLNAVKSLLPTTPVTRLGGANRYATGELVVKDAFLQSGADIAVIATGRNYPDALAAGPAAGYLGAPVVLVDGRGNIPASTQNMLFNLGISEAIVLGGPAVVSPFVESNLAGIVGTDNVYRIGGSNRYQTTEQLNAAVFPPSDDVFLASGANFPDALAGAPLAGAFLAPLVLTKPTCLSPEANSGIVTSRANGVTLLGGVGALSQAVAELQVCP